jgi:serine/threonine protein kinase
VAYVDHFEENGTVYLVTGYCKGKTLDKYLAEEKAVSLADVLQNVLLPVIRALDYIHEQGVLHRDINRAISSCEKRRMLGSVRSTRRTT